MAHLGGKVARLVKVAYLKVDGSTREVIGAHAFLDALPGPASEMKLHMICGPLMNQQEAVAYAMKVDAVMEAENKKTARRWGDV